MITYNYEIDMTPGGIPLEIYLKQYDSDFQIVFTLISRKGTLTVESGTTAKIRGTKPDGNGYSQLQTVNVSNKTVTVAKEESKHINDNQMLKAEYQNFAALNTHMIQKLMDKIEKLEKRIETLEGGKG